MITLEIVRFCAIECEHQGSGELSVYNMVNAWDFAQDRLERGMLKPTEEDMLHIGALVEPKWNKAGWRQVDVRVGWDVKMDWTKVPEFMHDLFVGLEAGIYTNEQFIHESLGTAHGFRDGNGRANQLIWNWLQGTLDHPTWHRDWWNDSRRKPNYGA